MHPRLASIDRELREASARLDRLIGGLDEETWATRPGAGEWSAAECVAHLNLTADGMLPGLRAGVEEAATLGASGSVRYRSDPVGWLFASLVGPLPRIAGRRRGRVSTTAPFEPGPDLPMAGTVERFRKDQAELLQLLERADGLPLSRVKVQSPFADRVRYNAYSTFRIIARHEHRHLQQAEEAVTRVREAKDRA